MKPKIVLYNNEQGTLWFADKAEGLQLPEELQYLYKGRMVTEGVNITFCNGEPMAYTLKYPLTVKKFEECPRFKHLIEEFELVNEDFEVIKTKETGALLQLDKFKGYSNKFTNVEFIYDTKTQATIFIALIS
jgi:hypothetical protein